MYYSVILYSINKASSRISSSHHRSIKGPIAQLAICIEAIYLFICICEIALACVWGEQTAVVVPISLSM